MANNGPYTFGFLSSIKGISFPSGYGLICVFATILQSTGSVALAATSVLSGPSAAVLSPAGIPFPIPLMNSDVPVPAQGSLSGPMSTGGSLITTIAANPFFFVQNYLAFRLTGEVTQVTLDAESPSTSINSLFYMAAFCSSLDFASFAQQGVNVVDQGSMTFRDTSGNPGQCSSSIGFTGSMIKYQDVDTGASLGTTAITFTRTGQMVTGA